MQRCFNRIEALQDGDGNWVWEADDIKRMVREFFLRLYTDNNEQYRLYILPSGRFPLLEAEDMGKLGASFTVREVLGPYWINPV